VLGGHAKRGARRLFGVEDFSCSLNATLTRNIPAIGEKNRKDVDEMLVLIWHN
jgi:hypothetical protein